jgi:serine/threonine protein kinase
MVNQLIVPGLLIHGRFEITRILASGFAGAVWLANDLETGDRVIVKFFSKRDAIHDEYYFHLVRLQKVLSSRPLYNLVCPIEIGKFGELAYQILPYFEGSTNLSSVLDADSFLRPTSALMLLAKIAAALDEVHRLGIIHADLKPSNILVTEAATPEVRLIDFGMIRRVDEAGTVELVSTWRYLHPIFTEEKTSEQPSEIQSGRPRINQRELPGTYIDIYALGIITLEMLTGKVKYDKPLTERSIQQVICAANSLFAAQPVGVRDGVSNLLFQMISIHPSRDIISARTISSIANTLLDAMKLETGASLASVHRASSHSAARKAAYTATAVIALRGVRSSLEQQTLALYAQGRGAAALASPDPDAKISEQVSAVFSNARIRTRSTWRLGMAMTVISFSLIVMMIVVAVGMSVFTGNYSWSLIFGGLGVSSIIGTLIWRPYDRLFRATILAQQIEVIHIRVLAGLQSVNRGEQLKVCQEAIEALGVIFREHAMGDKKLHTAKRGAGRKKRDPKESNVSSVPSSES